MIEEIKEVVYIAISAIILSVVLGFVSIMGTVQKDISATRNGELTGNKTMMQSSKYDKYNSREIVGEEVIECIRAYYDTGITIYVKAPGVALDTYNLDTFGVAANKQYFSADEGSAMLNWFPNSKKYRAYLVYNDEKPSVKYARILASGQMEDTDKAPVAGSEVTSIIIVDESLL